MSVSIQAPVTLVLSAAGSEEDSYCDANTRSARILRNDSSRQLEAIHGGPFLGPQNSLHLNTKDPRRDPNLQKPQKGKDSETAKFTIPESPSTQIMYTLAPKYLYRDHFKAKVYTIWVPGPLGESAVDYRGTLHTV